MSTNTLTIRLLLMHGLVLQPLCRVLTHLARKTLLVWPQMHQSKTCSPSLMMREQGGGEEVVAL